MITATLISEHVQRALDEDIGSGDITAQLIAPDQHASATITTRENGVLCGTAFATEAFRQVDPTCRLDWEMQDGDSLNAGERLCHIAGPARALLVPCQACLGAKARDNAFWRQWWNQFEVALKIKAGYGFHNRYAEGDGEARRCSPPARAHARRPIAFPG